MVDFIIVLILLLMVCAAIVFIRKQKKRGVKCIGCPDGGICSGNCENRKKEIQ